MSIIKNKTKLLNIIKLVLLISIPISLLFSIHLNSLFILLTFIIFIKSIIKNKRVLINKRFLKIFIVLNFVLFAFLLGTLLDIYNNTYNFSKLERLIPYIIFPIIFIIGFNNKNEGHKLIKLLSYFVTIVNAILFILAFSNSIETTSDKQFFDNKWSKNNLSIVKSNDLLAPDSISKVTKLIIDKTHNTHDLVLNVYDDIESKTNYVRSIYLKSNGKDWVLIRQYDGITHKGVWFNISKGIIGFQETGVLGKIEDYGNGWFRCSVLNRTSRRAKMERIQVTIVDDNKQYKDVENKKGDNGVYIWGAKLEKGTKASIYKIGIKKLNYKGLYRNNFLKPLKTHPTYYSIFVIIAILYFVSRLFLKFDLKYFIITLFNILIIILISSKGAILSLLIIIFLILLYSIKKHRAKKKYLFLLFGALLIMTSQSSVFKKRVTQTISTVLYKENYGLSTSDRLMVWKTTLNFSTKDLLIGMGNINGDNLLKDKSKLDLNAHNQYFQALINSGLMGLILLFIYLLSPLLLLKIPEENRIFTFGIVALFLTNILFESILNRQWGVVLISFFYSLLFVINNNQIPCKISKE